MKNQTLKKLLGIILICTSCITFLVLTVTLITGLFDPAGEKWLLSSVPGLTIAGIAAFFLFRYARSIYNSTNEPAEHSSTIVTRVGSDDVQEITKGERFRMRANSFNEIRTKIFYRTILIMIVVIVFVLYVTPSTVPDYHPKNIYDYFFLIPVIVALTVGLLLGIRRQRALFESYVLIIDDETISREQKNTPTISIRKSEITKITKSHNGSFTIKGDGYLNAIGIPSQIENYEQIEKQLNQVRSVTVRSSVPVLQRLAIPLALVPIGLMGIVYTTANKILVATCGTLLVVIIVLSFATVQRSKNFDQRTRRLMYLVLIPLLSILVMMIMKLAAR